MQFNQFSFSRQDNKTNLKKDRKTRLLNIRTKIGESIHNLYIKLKVRNTQ